MANTPPKTRNWKAWQDLQVGPGKTPTLYVTGQVETTNTNQTPHLKEHVPQGTNPKILLLNLTITTSGVGNAVVAWRDVRFEKKIKKDQYSSVDILWDGKSVGQAKVETVQ
ncbi:MAG: hypothetical protein WA418_31805 [Bradyrhizobium sp.]